MRLLWVGAAGLLATGCGRGGDGGQQTVTIFAAASTKEAVERTAADFRAETGVAVEVSLGPSPGLAKQIEQGAAADLFLSADQASADFLADKGLVEEHRDLLTNRLVVVVPRDSSLAVKELADLARPEVKRLALAEPKVPAGEYAREALAKAGALDRVADRVVGGIDVRATLQFVARGEADAGIVYATDAVNTSSVRVALEVGPSSHAPIRYPLVLVRHGPVKESARKFADFLRSERAAAAFRGAGFGVLP